MPRYIIVIIIAILFIGAGIYLYKNPPAQFKRSNISQQQAGYFSTDVSSAQLAKASEIIELKNGEAFNLEANIVKKIINGKEIKTLGYNNSIPGPTIKVPQGAEITINFKNNTDVDTTIHPHGVRVENKFDGVQDVTQKPIKPGDNFVYKFKFPDAGVYWYHPHIREDYAQDLGLYGNFLVTPTDSNYYSPVNREINLFLDDLLVDDSGQIVPFNKESATGTLMGRFGNVMLVNGETDYQMNAETGEVVRFYLTNTASSRTFNVSIPDAKIKKVGSDNGKYEKEEFVSEVLISPSERAIVEVLFENPGKYDLIHKTPEKTYTMGAFNVSGQTNASYLNQFNTLRTNQDVTSAIDPLRGFFTKTADKKLTLTLDMMDGQMEIDQSMPGMEMDAMENMDMSNMDMGDQEVQKIEWEDDMGQMNLNSNPKMMKWKLVDQATGRENMDLNWQFKKGDKVKISIFNDPKAQHPMQHPIHIHGQKFLVLSTNGVQNTNLVFKDSVLIQTGDTVELLVEMDNPGDWLIHCHIPEHMEAGMMGKFQVN